MSILAACLYWQRKIPIAGSGSDSSREISEIELSASQPSSSVARPLMDPHPDLSRRIQAAQISLEPPMANRPPEPPVPTGFGSEGKLRVYGVVYDMRSAASIAGASIYFRTSAGLIITAATNKDGHYGLDIPAGFFYDRVSC